VGHENRVGSSRAPVTSAEDRLRSYASQFPIIEVDSSFTHKSVIWMTMQEPIDESVDCSTVRLSFKLRAFLAVCRKMAQGDHCGRGRA
jgi:hypothetical protein